MTIKELIKQLQQVENQDIEVIIKGTGPDEWVYMNEIEELKVTYTMMEDEGLMEVDEDDFDEDDDVKQVLVIDGGMF
jgi:hypothetical protein